MATPLSTHIDRKRIYGPESSVVPLPFVDEKENEQAKLLGKGERLDASRTMDSIRSIFMKTGIIPQADGSSFIEMGNLKLLCAVYGPKPDRKVATTEKGKLSVHFRLATFASPQRKSFLKDATERDYSTLLLNALLPTVRLTSFPKSLVEVHVTVLENDGIYASLASSVTAASLALVDAGIEVMDLVAGSSAGTLDTTSVVMDLTLEEEKYQKACFLVASSSHQVTQLVQAGEMETVLAEEMMELCIDACAEIHSLMARCLRETAQKKFLDLESTE